MKMKQRKLWVAMWMALGMVGLGSAPALAQDDLSLNVVIDAVRGLSDCVSTGQAVEVTLDVANLSAAINGAQVRLNYDTTLMTLVDIVPTDLGLSPPDEGWVEISETNVAGDIDWAAVINGSGISVLHTIATLKFTAIADGTAGVTFRLDSPPFLTKLTRAIDSSTIIPNKINSGGIFIGPPDCTITGENAVCDGTSGHIVSVPNAGVGSVYAWTVTGGTIEDTPPFTNSISYTAGAVSPVTIDITVTDPNGCQSTCQKIVTVNPNPDCTITAADSVCANSTLNPASVPVAVPTATYLWVVTGGSITSGQNSPSIQYTAGAGPSMTIDVTVTDGNGCISSCQKIVTVAAPDCTITAADEVCDLSTANQASVPNAGGGATYSWTVTGGTITSVPPFTDTIFYTATNPTSVTIDVTVVGGAGCQSSCQKIVSVNANPDATITTISPVCAGSTTNGASVPVAFGVTTYAWTMTGGTIESTPPFTESITYTAGAGPTVTIDITVTDGNGCISSSQTVVTVNANPDATITAPPPCDGTSGNSASVPIAVPTATYAWTMIGGTIDTLPPFTDTISYTAVDPTSVTIDVTVTDGNGCISSSQSVVTVNPNPDCTITAADAVCDGSTGNTASAPTTGSETYAWTITGGTIDTGATTDTITYTAVDPTTVTLQVVVTDTNGCVNTCQKVVSVAANPTCIITADAAVCADSTGNVASTADVGPGTTYAWTITGGTIEDTPPFTNSIFYTAGAGLTVTVDLTVTEAGGCVSTCQQVVPINQNPDATITTASAVCDGSTGNGASVPVAFGVTTYAWTISGGTIEDIPPFTESITYTAGAAPGPVTIDITITDGNGCISSSQTVVTVNPNPDATITTAAAVCDGSTGNVASVPVAFGVTTYAWTMTGGTIESIPPFTESITYTAGTGPTVTIDITITDGNGCTSSSQTVVTVNANPDATITTASAVCDGSTGNVASVPVAFGVATYAWTMTGGTIESSPPFTESITYTAGAAPGPVTIDITITDGNGCISSSQTVVTVNPNPPCTITAAAEVCADSTGNTAFVSATAGASYAWTVTGGTLDSGDGTTGITYTAGAGATVTLDVTVTDANGCVSSCQQIVTVNPLPDCTISADDLVCAGFSGNIASVPNTIGAAYLWTVSGGSLNTGQGTTSITYTAGTGTSLTLEVTVTDANGCIKTCQKIVTVDAPDCTILGANDVCFQSINNFASVTAGATAFSWVVTGGSLTSGQNTDQITYTAGSGLTVTLDVTVTNANGCVSSCQKIVNIIQPSIDVTLELEGVSSAAPVVTRNVSFLITDCGGSTDPRTLPVTASTVGTAGMIGTVTISSTNPNADWISVQEGHTLSRLAAVTYGSCSVANVVLTLSGSGSPLLAGDFQSGTEFQDNLCDITDYSILASRWNQPIDANLSEGADATGDGLQFMADFTAIQVNFFKVGEAPDGCVVTAGSDLLGEAEMISVDPVRVDTQPRLRSSVAVNRLEFPDAQRADINGDGTVDSADILAFAEKHNLRLLPSFRAKLAKLERAQKRKNRSR